MTERSRYNAYFQIVAGTLIAGLCGLCTLNVVTSDDEYGFNVLGWFFGGIPTAMGVVFLVLGLRNLRRWVAAARRGMAARMVRKAANPSGSNEATFVGLRDGGVRAI